MNLIINGKEENLTGDELSVSKTFGFKECYVSSNGFCAVERKICKTGSV